MRAFHIFLSVEKGAAYMPDQDPKPQEESAQQQHEDVHHQTEGWRLSHRD
jgi:hypothetical protein